MTHQIEQKNSTLKFLQTLLFPLAFLFIIFILAEYFYHFIFPYSTIITNFALLFFVILNLYKIILFEADLDFLKKNFIDILAIVISILFHRQIIIFQFFIILRQAFILIDIIVTSEPALSLFARFKNHPAKMILLSFATVIIFGAIFLSLPMAASSGRSIGFTNAIFTSTSATCVTGLVVVDTGSVFSHFGKLIILLLLQIGGLGIMTFSTALILLFGKRMSAGGESLMHGIIDDVIHKNLNKLVRTILFTTLTFELIGAALLFIRFHTEFVSIKTALWYSLFHSVSAFCNAGFSFYADSFVRFRGNLIINFTIMGLIIAGGIGFSVLMDIKRIITHKKPLRFLTLHSKIVLTVTFFLIITGALLIFLFEYSQNFSRMPIRQGLLASLFQSVTARTAGFNTMDIGKISYATGLWLMVLMFIGASPGSTGGGVKTTTFALMILSVISIIKGRDEVEVYKSSISQRVIKKVMALIAISVGILIGAILILCITETDAKFIKILFEAFSAFGTVGLSMGLTSKLTIVGKFSIIILMYLGRVGPLTIAFALGEKKFKSSYRYTEGQIAIG
ncbi:MAG: TrkH family potassium uptake protein [Candidatus Cloacimonadota bacterium]|nr:TrkH family potassium uptake protein [Candidatus Cloacimonadota bacterium]